MLCRGAFKLTNQRNCRVYTDSMYFGQATESNKIEMNIIAETSGKLQAMSRVDAIE